ncbi:MAG: hypothetical protein ACXWRE_17130, partial [Pseudobdellovibrionaceae bacterium]
KIDVAAVQFEKAKREMENAKLQFERSKQAYEEVLSQAESLGLSKSKLKRVAEERLNALLENGLIDIGKTVEAKTEKPVKAKKKERTADSEENSKDIEKESEKDNFEAQSESEMLEMNH